MSSISENSIGAFGSNALQWHEAVGQVFPSKVPIDDGSEDWKVKRPLVKGVTGRKDLITKAHIDEWLASPRFCQANIGWRLPDGVIGIDVDQYDGKQGFTELANLQKSRKLSGRPKTIVVTARGGDSRSGIRLYQVPKGLDWRGQACAGVDIIKPGHRFISLPPSLHHSGGIYKWYDQREGKGAVRHHDQTFSLEDLPYLPDDWVEFLSKGAARQLESVDLLDDEVAAWLNSRPGPHMCARMRKASQEAAVEFGVDGDGGAYSLANKHSWSLLNLAAEGHGGVSEALKVAKAGFLGTLLERGDQARLQAAYGEWGRLVADGVSKLANGVVVAQCLCGEPGLADGFTDKFLEHNDFGETDLSEEAAAELLAAAFFTQAEIDNPPEPTPTEYGAFGGETPLFYGKGVHWLQGESESGKSWVALCVAIEHLQRGLKVAYLDYEDTRNNLLERLQCLGAKPDEIARFAHLDADFPLSYLVDRAADFSLVVVDGVTSALGAYGGDGRESAERTTEWVNAVPRKFGASIMVDHVTKAKDNRAGMAYGSQAKKAVVTGSSFEVECTNKFGRGVTGQIQLKCQKDKPGYLGEERKKPICLEFVSDPDTYAVVIQRVAGKADSVKEGMDSYAESLRVGLAIKAFKGKVGRRPNATELRAQLNGGTPTEGRQSTSLNKVIAQAEADQVITWEMVSGNKLFDEMLPAE